MQPFSRYSKKEKPEVPKCQMLAANILKLILLESPNLQIVLSSLVSNPISPIESLNHVSNNKMPSLKSSCIGEILPYPSFRQVKFCKICPMFMTPCVFDSNAPHYAPYHSPNSLYRTRCDPYGRSDVTT